MTSNKKKKTLHENQDNFPFYHEIFLVHKCDVNMLCRFFVLMEEWKSTFLPLLGIEIISN